MDGITSPPAPFNEPVENYPPGSSKTQRLLARATEMSGQQVELTMTIDGKQVMAGGERVAVVTPHRHSQLLGVSAQATVDDVSAAVNAACDAAAQWRALPFDDRAAVFLRAADLLSGPWRDTLNAATMLGQSKTVFQAEIDAVCELADFFRFNVYFARQLFGMQPISSAGMWNRMDYRPLEGFVVAITPFNFTSIAGNLPAAPALLGNSVVWKPSPTQQLAAHYTLRLLEEAGLPPGVINMVTGDGAAVSEVALTDRRLAGIHFTGSTKTFQHLWSAVASNLPNYLNYPRLVGETGGKDFIVAHPSADSKALLVGLIRGAFEYQGQKCSAASRAYLPLSLWDGGLRSALIEAANDISFGDVLDRRNFGGAVIDERAFSRLTEVLNRLNNDPECIVLAGGSADKTEGYFVEPTIVVSTNPKHEIFSQEFFGPILGIYVYEDSEYQAMLQLAADTSPYALTGAVFATDRLAIQTANDVLRYSAGNFYINDKPTGAVVGQQPFGGARASGTNDKAGSILNLMRWISPRTIKETLSPALDYRYPHME